MLLTTDQVAVKLGVSARRVLAMIRQGKLPAKRYGWAWLVEDKDLALVKNRKPGQPRKIKKEKK